MTKKVDIDALLADDELEIVLCGETYILQDIPLPVFLEAARHEEGEEGEDALSSLHKQLAAILGVDEEKLANVGLKAAGLTINEIRNWVLQAEGMPSELNASKEEDKPKNP